MTTPIQAILTHKGAQVHSATPDLTVAEAVHRMNAHNIGALVVMDGPRLIGIITERDVLLRVIDAGLDPSSTPVSKAMTADPITIVPSMTTEAAMRLITNERCRHLPVVENDRLLGLVSIGDLLYWMLYDQGHEIDELRHYITDTPPGPLYSSAD